ncbi:rhomboid family intramembrane serine protease [Methylocystis suflitae]|uniref:rhomboid family intramembrane serine protease n=1 Tax=Methylocystis suflitae TaxID=2951405 RepID=UPI0021095C21|nr:rhomboid family intramembrane serine protease [Methylocystis suflitae]MCQ4189423.1 rhomboid family intramembrane serine protease [Methylocystis suflitae]
MMTILTLDLVAIGSSSSVDIRRSAFVAANFIDLQPHQDLDPIASDLGRNEAMVAATRRTAAAVSLGEALYPPSAITLIVCILTAMHFAAALLPLPVVVDALSTLSFVPPRLSFLFAPDAAMGAFASATAAGVDEHDIIKLRSGVGQAWWTLVTYALLHGSWMHLATNCLALAVFGSPVARRFGTSGFLAFFAVAVIAGALAYFLFHPFDIAPVIGASAAVSAAAAASARIVFAPGGPFGESTLALTHRAADGQTRAPTLSDMLTNRAAVGFLGFWFSATLLSGLFPQANGISNHIAWEAHVGGFLAGLLLFDLFDRSAVTALCEPERKSREDAFAAAPRINDFQQFGKEQREALSTPPSSLAKTWQEMVEETTGYSKESFETSSVVFEKLLGAKSIENTLQIQSDYAEASYRRFFEYSTKLGKLYCGLSKAPLTISAATAAPPSSRKLSRPTRTGRPFTVPARAYR